MTVTGITYSGITSSETTSAIRNTHHRDGITTNRLSEKSLTTRSTPADPRFFHFH